MVGSSIAEACSLRERSIQELLSRRDPVRVKQGVDAYLRDLPTLLRERKQGYLVAYLGETQQAIARTSRDLERQLRDKNLLQDDNLFISSVFPLDTEF